MSFHREIYWTLDLNLNQHNLQETGRKFYPLAIDISITEKQ